MTDSSEWHKIGNVRQCIMIMGNYKQWKMLYNGGIDKQWGTTNNVEIQTMRNKNDAVW